MSKSVLKPPIIQDNATKIAIDELYRQVNKLLTSISANAQNYGNEALEGSVRAIYEGKDNFRIEGKTSAGWASVTAQAQGKGNLYKNSPKIDSNGRLNINNVIYGKQNLELHSGKKIKLNSTESITLDSSQGIYLDSGNGRYFFYKNGDTDDYMRITVTSNGETLFSTYDSDGAEGHLTFSPDGKIKFAVEDGATDSIQCNVGGTTFASFAAEDGSYSRLTMYEQGGSSSDDYMKLDVEEHGATTLTTHDTAGGAANLTFTVDGHATIDCRETVILDGRDTSASGKHIIFKPNGSETGFIYHSTLNLKEAASSPGIEQEYGQLWVKNDTPNNLYFRDDVGNNVQLTNNGATVDNRWRYHQNARFYTRYDNWYYPSTVYGMNSVNWSSTSSSSTKRTTWLDSYNPCLVITDDITLTEYYFYGNFTSSQTYELCMLKGTGVTYGSAGNYTLSAIGSTQSVSATGNILYKIGETGLSVSLSAGDIIIPALRRTTTDTSTYYYFEFSMNLKGVYV
tara:strand:+ start:16489 stop:18021 length:1533 start_codon:yes stop_codon:yes gene_type:complete